MDDPREPQGIPGDPRGPWAKNSKLDGLAHGDEPWDPRALLQNVQNNDSAVGLHACAATKAAFELTKI